MLEAERRSLQREFSTYGGYAADLAVPLYAASPAMDQASGTAEQAAEPGESEVEAAEATLRGLCAAVEECTKELLEQEGLVCQNELAAVAEIGATAGAPLVVTSNNLLCCLGILETAAVRLARQHRGMLQAKAEAEARAIAEAEAAEAASRGEDGEPGSPQRQQAPGARSIASLGTSFKAPTPGRRKLRRSALDNLVGRAPPSMEGIVSNQSKGDDEVAVIGIGELKYGRRSLKTELMSQILAGVPRQMEKLEEEEILVRIGEKTRDPTTESTPIDKAKRDSDIEAWLARRNSLHGRDSRVILSSHAVQSGKGSPARVGVARSPPPNVGAKEMSPSTPTGPSRRGTSPATGPCEAHRASAPGMFSNISSREVLDSVSRSRSDSSRVQSAVAARLPRVGQAAAHGPSAHGRALTGSRSLVSLDRGRPGAASTSALKAHRVRPVSPASPAASTDLLQASATSKGTPRSAPGRPLATSASTPALAPVAKDTEGAISELEARLTALKAERRQIKELKALAMAKPARAGTKVSAAYGVA